MSKTNRIKLPAPEPIATRADAENKLGEIAQLVINQTRLTNEMNAAIKSIRDRFDPSLNEIAIALEAATLALQAWAEANQPEFGKLKSIDTTHGLMGWRINPPKLKPLSGWTWDRVLEAIRLKSPVFLRTKEEVDKAAILGARETLGAEGLKTIGLRVVQDEDWFVDPHLTEVEKRQAA